MYQVLLLLYIRYYQSRSEQYALGYWLELLLTQIKISIYLVQVLHPLDLGPTLHKFSAHIDENSYIIGLMKTHI